jgi:hypothetical protein
VKVLRGESVPTREKEGETDRKKGDWRGLGSRFPFPNNIRAIVLTRADGIYKTLAECEKGQYFIV